MHEIKTKEQKPIRVPSRRIPVHLEQTISKEIEKNLGLGIIRESNSPWCAPIVPVPNPNDEIRMCVDYRKLNEVTAKDSYPIPNISEIIDGISGEKLFSTLDAKFGYYQTGIAEEDKQKTAFEWKGRLYEFNRMPFGLCNAPSTFQRAMNSVFKGEFRKFGFPYLDT